MSMGTVNCCWLSVSQSCVHHLLQETEGSIKKKTPLTPPWWFSLSPATSPPPPPPCSVWEEHHSMYRNLAIPPWTFSSLAFWILSFFPSFVFIHRRAHGTRAATSRKVWQTLPHARWWKLHWFWSWWTPTVSRLPGSAATDPATRSRTEPLQSPELPHPPLLLLLLEYPPKWRSNQLLPNKQKTQHKNIHKNTNWVPQHNKMFTKTQNGFWTIYLLLWVCRTRALQ